MSLLAALTFGIVDGPDLYPSAAQPAPPILNASRPASATAASTIDVKAGPASMFARGVLADAPGRYLGDLRVDSDDRSGNLRLALVLVGSADAVRHTLEYDQDGNGAVAYRRAAAPMPRERRVYPIEPELLRLLAIAPPAVLDAGCTAYYLEVGVGEAGVDIDESDYYVVSSRTRGAGAEVALRDALLAAFHRDLHLVEVRAPESAAEAREVSFVFDGGERQIVRALVDADGRPIDIEVRSGPAALTWQDYTRARDLGVFLRGHKRVERLTISEAGTSGDDASVSLGGFTIEMSDFEPANDECPC